MNKFKSGKVLTIVIAISMITSFSRGYFIHSSIDGLSNNEQLSKNKSENRIEEVEKISLSKVNINYDGKKPKYIFLFIGDGMSYSQLQLADYYLKETEKSGLNILKLSTNGTMQNYDNTSLIPDSASTATAMSTGKKTQSGNLNVSDDGSEKFEIITQKLKEDGFKIGITTTVNINHATPAGFSAHQESRKGYYEIGKEMLSTDFDYFAGGKFKDEKGDNEKEKSLVKIAEENGYTVADTKEEMNNLGKESGSKEDNDKYIVISEDVDKSGAMEYSIDGKSDSLSDYVRKGIELLDGDEGFFMMIEGGKIDWACHRNDAATALHDTIELDNAVDEALKFYNSHKEETLIIVTGDHETGGLSIGNSVTEYDTYLENLGLQKMSCDKFNEEFVKKYKKEKTDFEVVLKDIEEVFGIRKPKKFESIDANVDSDDNHKHSSENNLKLTKSEYERLKKAYDLTLRGKKKRTKEESMLYGSHEPITVEAARILGEKSGVGFNSFSHTAAPMAVYCVGVGEEIFTGMYDNTELYEKLIDVIY